MVWALLRRTEVWAAHRQQEVSGFQSIHSITYASSTEKWCENQSRNSAAVCSRTSLSGFKSAPFCLHLLPTDLSNPATLQGDSHLRVSRQNENSASTRQVKGSEFSGYLATPLEACPAPTTPL